MSRFDGENTTDLLKEVLNSRCPHGYSKRKNCSRCQSATRRAGEPKAPSTRRSVYDTRHANNA